MEVGDGAVVLVVRDDDSMSPVEVARWLQERLDGWPPEDVVLVGVVAGELFDNAVNHGSAPYVLELDLDEFGETMLVTVHDRARDRASRWRRSAGLLLVDALSSRWGVLSRDGTTTVWAKLDFED
ncbi:ATP-binding protein [Actinosynnema sp. NPDC002837]